MGAGAVRGANAAEIPRFEIVSQKNKVKSPAELQFDRKEIGREKCKSRLFEFNGQHHSCSEGKL